jgi:hypothetical protein
MESMHTREDIKFLVEKSLETLLAFMARVDFNAPVLDHSQFLFESLSV